MRSSPNQPRKAEPSSKGGRGASLSCIPVRLPSLWTPGCPALDQMPQFPELSAGPKASGSLTDNRHSDPRAMPRTKQGAVCKMLPRARLKQHSCWHLPAVLRTLGPTCRDPKSPQVSTGHWSTGRGRAGGGHGSGEQPVDPAAILSPKAGGVRKLRLPRAGSAPGHAAKGPQLGSL